MSIESRKISLNCPTCGNDQFACIDEEFGNLSDAPNEIRLRCADCGSILTKGELIESNQDIINANIEDVKKEAVKELEKKLKKMFK